VDGRKRFMLVHCNRSATCCLFYSPSPFIGLADDLASYTANKPNRLGGYQPHEPLASLSISGWVGMKQRPLLSCLLFVHWWRLPIIDHLVNSHRYRNRVLSSNMPIYILLQRASKFDSKQGLESWIIILFSASRVLHCAPANTSFVLGLISFAASKLVTVHRPQKGVSHANAPAVLTSSNSKSPLHLRHPKENKRRSWILQTPLFRPSLVLASAILPLQCYYPFGYTLTLSFLHYFKNKTLDIYHPQTVWLNQACLVYSPVPAIIASTFNLAL